MRARRLHEAGSQRGVGGIILHLDHRFGFHFLHLFQSQVLFLSEASKQSECQMYIRFIFNELTTSEAFVDLLSAGNVAVGET